MTQKGKMQNYSAIFFNRFLTISKDKGPIKQPSFGLFLPYIIEELKRLHVHFSPFHFKYQFTISRVFSFKKDYSKLNRNTDYIKNKNAFYGNGSIQSKTLEYILST